MADKENNIDIKNAERANSSKPTASPYARKRFNVRQLTVVGLLAAITVILGITGFGFIRIPPINFTILHIPTLIGALVEGPRVGMIVGTIFGGYSIVQNIMAPNVMSFAFLNPIVSVLPRMLIGPICYYVYRLLPLKSEVIRIVLGLFLGTMMHTIMVMGLIYIIYAEPYAQASNIPVENVLNIVLGVAIFHGPIEALGAVLVGTPIVVALRAKLKK
ncbi:ECF transporter S component [uncultured Veillonella sp.]|uniref:ECF transporter S component n=1 Tax=uncultured Veillonella sp. TaxID=159268 RepID=UPI002621B9E4|nr:ECF transporter S component [uncultured Veillonella sp.]